MSIVQDIEKLILEVERRPPLYNKKLKEYSDRNLKDKLWYEVYESVVTKWSELPAAQKSEKFSPGTCPVTQSFPRGHQLPQLSSLSIITVPALSPVKHLPCQVKMGVVTSLLSYLLVQQRICKLNFFFHFSIQIL
jgi:hypothetical protein